MIPPASIQLHDNLLTGSVPDVSKNQKLSRLELSDNMLSGRIDDKGIFELPNLILLYLNGNQLSGDIPANFGASSNLEDLILDDNEFTGIIPTITGTSLQNISKY